MRSRGSLGMIFSLLSMTAVTVSAQERQAEDRPAEGSRRFFDREIDFWRTGALRRQRSGRAARSKGDIRETIWAEPVRMPDGRYSVYVPPLPVLEFLEDPTRENLLGYLRWKRERAEKLGRALKLLQEYRRQVAGRRSDAGEPAGTAKSRRGSRDETNQALGSGQDELEPGGVSNGTSLEAISVLYFHQKG